MKAEKAARLETEDQRARKGERLFPGDSGPGDGSSAQGQDQKTETNIGEKTGNTQATDDSLYVFLPWMDLTSETVSYLARQRESFGLAWLSVFLLNQNRKLGKNPVTPPRSIDLSGTRGLSPEKIFLFLDSLPPSVEEMKLDSVAVKGRALPLLLRYLERLQAARTEGRQAPRLRSFTFAEDSIGSEEASKIFPLLLPFLETLCVKGNPLGHEGIRAVAEGVREGKAASLRVLDLEKTGLEKEGLKSLCGALKETSLPVETLNCSGNTIGFKRTPGDSFFLQHIFSRVEYGVEEMQRLSSVLCLSSLPFVRQLLLRECGLTDMAVEPLTESIAKKKLPNLEMLDLGGNDFGGRFLGFFEKALRADAVPCLKGLNIENARNRAPESKEPVSAFLKALSAPECPPQLQVSGLRLCPLDLNEQEVRALGAFQYPSLRSLNLYLSHDQAIPFLQGRVGAEEARGPIMRCLTWNSKLGRM